jgi:site-specific DNA-methyltransferase (adenine-specific)
VARRLKLGDKLDESSETRENIDGEQQFRCLRADATIMTVRILVGDAKERLAEVGDADVVITDPVWPNCPPRLLPGWDRPGAVLREALEVMPASVRAVVIVMRSDGDPRFLQAVPGRWPFICVQVMPYTAPTYIGRVLATELAYCFGAPASPRPGRDVIPMWGPQAPQREGPANGHPCPRAMVHMEWLVDCWSEPGETVLDPFCGSGTIPMAADQMHRHGIGIEIDPDYAAAAMRRAERDRSMFAVER